MPTQNTQPNSPEIMTTKFQAMFREQLLAGMSVKRRKIYLAILCVLKKYGYRPERINKSGNMELTTGEKIFIKASLRENRALIGLPNGKTYSVHIEQ